MEQRNRPASRISEQTACKQDSRLDSKRADVHGRLSAHFVAEAPSLCLAALGPGRANYINRKQINAWRRLKSCGKWLEVELTWVSKPQALMVSNWEHRLGIQLELSWFALPVSSSSSSYFTLGFDPPRDDLPIAGGNHLIRSDSGLSVIQFLAAFPPTV